MDTQNPGLNPLESSPLEIQQGWGLLRRINHELKPATVEALLCDYMNLTPNRARTLIQTLVDRGHLTWEPGWLKLTDVYGKAPK